MQETLKQVAAVRDDVGWFDRSSMGKLAITGADRYSWLQGMVSGDVRRLEKHEAARLPACILDPTGHIVADITLVEVPAGCHTARAVSGDGFILLESPPGDAERIAGHLLRYLIMEDADVLNVTERFLCTTIQGPATENVRRALDVDCETALIVEADHTGSGGVDVYCAAVEPTACRKTVMDLAVVEIGPAAREILRIEAGIPLYGVDMDAATLAPEAGLGSTHISLTKGCYVGQEIVARIDSRGHTNRALTGLLVMGETAPAPGEKLFTDDVSGEGREAGWITSVAPFSPAVGGRPIALGYVRHEYRAVGTWLRLGSADSGRRAEVSGLPFYSRDKVSRKLVS